MGCEPFRVGNEAIDGSASELRIGIPDGLLLEGGATGRAHLFNLSGGAARAASGTIDGWKSGLWTDISDGLLLEGGATGCWGRDQTLGVGVRRGVSGSGDHLYRYGTVSGALGC